MYLEFQISASRLSDLIQNSIEQNVMVRDIGLSGLLPNVPFFTSIVQLLNNETESTTAVVDHIRLTSVRLRTGGGFVPAGINVPPALLSLFPAAIPIPRSASIDIRPVQVSATLDVHIVKKDDMHIANGNAIATLDTMVVQFRPNFAIAPLAISGSTLAIAPIVVDVEFGAFGLFVSLPPPADRAGLDPAAQLALFRARNPVVGSRLDDARLTDLLNVMLLINSATVLGNLAIPPIR
jgi:hypothetical protein